MACSTYVRLGSESGNPLRTPWSALLKGIGAIFEGIWSTDPFSNLGGLNGVSAPHHGSYPS